MAFPASRDSSGQLNTLYSTAFESVAKKAQDLVYKETVGLWAAQEMGFYKTGNYSHHHIVPVIDKDDVSVVSFTNYDTLPTTATIGARSAYFGFANYDTNITISWQDEMDMHDPYQITDHVENVTFKAYRALGARLDQDFFWGQNNTGTTKNILGLEQALPPVTQLTTNPVLTAKRWEFRQATNTYGGVARTAFTADGVGGTNWEHNSVDFEADVTNGTGANESDFQLDSNVPNAALKLLNHFIHICTYGDMGPDLIISTFRPVEDLQSLSTSLLRFGRNGAEAKGSDLGVKEVYYKGIRWLATEKAQASGLAPDGGGTTSAGADLIYFLTTSVVRWLVHAAADFARTDFVTPVDQAASVAHVRHRSQLVIENPRYCGVATNYGKA